MKLNGLLGTLDPMWVEHGHRVRGLTAELGRRIGFTGHQLNRLEIAALLHDIGKAELDPDVLCLPRALTAPEREHVQQHPQYGYDMLDGNVHPDIADAVLGHHERFDGTGYPHNLIGDAIPLAARVLAVADAFDAIVSDRPYDGSRSIDIAAREIRLGSGTQFDPFVVEAFEGLLANPPAALLPTRLRPVLAVA